MLKGRGAQIHPNNPFIETNKPKDPNSFNDADLEVKTQYIEVDAKTIVNTVESPDIPFGYSLNPYQGCEHGCVYCYARNSHNYWGYDAGIEFETKILIKRNAPELLKKRLKSKSWQGDQIMLSGNTDCYQPIESKYKLTRALLEVCIEFGNPVGLITKNSMITRDLDLLQKLHKYNLISVAISINTLQDEVRAFLEPRTATIAKRLKTIQTLSKAGIPVVVLIAPIIPGLTDHDILPLAKACKEAGAISINHIIVRLNGSIAEVFEDWAHKAFPNRAKKILQQIKETHEGKLNDSSWGKRMKGSGKYADIIAQQVSLAKKLYFANPQSIIINSERYNQLRNPQLNLF